MATFITEANALQVDVNAKQVSAAGSASTADRKSACRERVFFDV
jgi:hypothetical protein